MLFSIFLIPVIWKLCAGFEYFLSNISGKVDKNNFAYHSMPYDGTVLLELVSLSGDCDLYASQITEKPSYEPESNCLSSITCGVDSVIIPKSFKRPVGIGIFSHPSHDFCSYNLVLYRVDDSRDIFNFDPYKISPQSERGKNVHDKTVDPTTSESAGESFFWVLLRDAFFWVLRRDAAEFWIDLIL